MTTAHLPAGFKYRESERLTKLGGFLMAYGTQRRITMNAQLTDEEKSHGIRYLLDQLAQASEKQGVYLWIDDSLTDSHKHVHADLDWHVDADPDRHAYAHADEYAHANAD